jgi:hypothetical protein
MIVDVGEYSGREDGQKSMQARIRGLCPTVVSGYLRERIALCLKKAPKLGN